MHSYGPLFRMLHNSISQRMNNALSAMELTSSQGHILCCLACFRKPPCPKDIEEKLQLSHPTVSGLLSRMEKKNFIRFEPDPDDGRCKRVYIQPRGRACMEKMHATITDIEQQIVLGFTREEKRQFAELLARAARNMGGLPLQPDFKEDSET